MVGKCYIVLVFYGGLVDMRNPGKITMVEITFESPVTEETPEMVEYHIEYLKEAHNLDSDVMVAFDDARRFMMITGPNQRQIMFARRALSAQIELEGEWDDS